MDIALLVATHKDYWMPDDPIYLPVQVGAAGSDSDLGFRRDDEGNNISSLNPRYSELTAVYWAWKNLKADAVGLAHYRRHFKGTGERNTLAGTDARALLDRAPIVLPKLRKYYVETVESHYGHTFDPAHLEILRSVLAELSPASVESFDTVLASRSAHIFNMFLMRRNFFDDYCAWMFPILFETEKRIDFDSMTPFQARVMGRLSERLMDTWILSNSYGFAECPVVAMEKTNWLKKGGGFLAAKFLGRKYSASF